MSIKIQSTSNLLIEDTTNNNLLRIINNTNLLIKRKNLISKKFSRVFIVNFFFYTPSSLEEKLIILIKIAKIAKLDDNVHVVHDQFGSQRISLIPFWTKFEDTCIHVVMLHDNILHCVRDQFVQSGK